jgi:peroxiredoxin Q/BCP
MIRKKFGVPSDFMGLIPGRVTYIIDREGKVVHVFNSQLQTEKHVDEALKILKELN